MKNWKTTVTGLLALVPTLLHTVLPDLVSAESAMNLTALLTSLGLISAKDHNVTGGKVEQ